MGGYWERMKSYNNVDLMIRIGLCGQEKVSYALEKLLSLY